MKKDDGRKDTSPSSSETRSLLQARSMEEAGVMVENYMSTESQQVIDTDTPTIAKEIYKDWLLFQNAGLAIEFITAVLTGYLGFVYLFSACLFTSISSFVICGSAAYLSVPQLALPFISNPLIRWFIVTNHSYHISGIFALWFAFMWISYFSWFNMCIGSSKSVRAVSATVSVILPVGIIAFLIACYRNEKGNGGFLRWIFKFFI
jgi:hypothetical protein